MAQEIVSHAQVLQLGHEFGQGRLLVVESAYVLQSIARGRIHGPNVPVVGHHWQGQRRQALPCQSLRVGDRDAHPVQPLTRPLIGYGRELVGANVSTLVVCGTEPAPALAPPPV